MGDRCSRIIFGREYPSVYVVKSWLSLKLHVRSKFLLPILNNFLSFSFLRNFSILLVDFSSTFYTSDYPTKLIIYTETKFHIVFVA